MRGVILAGGSGTRLHPVTLETPKPLLTVNRKPILNHLLSFFAKHGVDDSVILINKNHTEDFQWWQKRYENELGGKIELAVEHEPLGTFGGLKLISEKLTEPFILSNGDELKDFDLSALIKAHKENPAKPAATIALVKVDNAQNFGVPIMEGNSITQFLEKPKELQSSFVSSGIYILEPEALRYADFSKGFLMIEKDIFPKMAQDGKLAGHRVENYRWFPCDTLEKWEHAIKNW